MKPIERVYDNCGRVLLFKSGGIVSKLIQWQTRSEYSHAAILYPDGVTIIEAMQGVGVRNRVLSTDELVSPAIDTFAVVGSTPAQWGEVIAFCEGELKSGYDYRSIVRFLTRTNAGSDTRWFCSELVFAALQKARIDLLARTQAWKVAPGHLGISPLLHA